MILNGLVLSADVMASTFYDQGTGAPKHGYSIKMTVLDVDTDEKYECQLTDGFSELDELKDLRRQGAPVEALAEVAARLRGNLPPKMTALHLEVVRIKAKQGFLTLVCRFARVGAAV